MKTDALKCFNCSFMQYVIFLSLLKHGKFFMATWYFQAEQGLPKRSIAFDILMRTLRNRP
jgi:hypothetical protein